VLWAVRYLLAILLLAALPFLTSGGAAAQGNPKVEVVAQLGHSISVSPVAFSPDGRSTMSGSQDNTIKLWDVATGRLLRTFQGHRAEVKSVAFSPDGRSVLSGSSELWGSSDNTLKLWDAATGRQLRTFEGHSSGTDSVAFSPDGRRALSGGADNTLKLWDVATGRLLRTVNTGHSGGAVAVAFSPDGRSALSGSLDRTLKLWDVATGRLLRTLKGHSREVKSVAFSPDGRSVLSGSHDKTLKLWDPATGRLLRTFQGHSDEVMSVAFAPDGRSALSGSSDRTLKLWDAATGQLLRTFEGHSNTVRSVAFSPDGRSALSGSDNTLKLWDVATGRLMGTFQGHSDAVASVAFSSEGRSALSGSDNTLKLWDVARGRLLRTFQGHSSWVQSVALSADGRSALSGSSDKMLKLWDVATGQLLRTFEGHPDPVISVAFSPDGRSALSGGANTPKLWDVATGRLLRTLEGHRFAVRSVAFSSDGRRALWSGVYDNTLTLSDVATGRQLRTFQGHSSWVQSVALSADGRSALSGSSDRTLKLWDAATGQLLRTFEGHSDTVRSVAFSPDGRTAMSGSEDNTLKLWDAATGQLLRTFKGHSAAVNAVAFSFDGRGALSGSSDGTVRLWSAATGREIVRLLASRGGDWLAITPAGFFDFKGDVGEFVHIVRGLEPIAISQVHQSLYNPDLVGEGLAGDPAGEVAAAAEVVNLDKVVASGPAPTVLVVSPARSAIDVVTVEARVTDRGKGVGRIEWRVNGVTAAVLAKAPGSGSTYTVARQLALDPGDNTVEVVAYNGKNLLASLPARTTVKFTGPADKAKPRLHILAIGINRYVDDKLAPSLEFAEKDAAAFAESLKTAAAGLYDKDSIHITPVVGKDATRANLERTIDSIAADIHPRDTFILFASGHGTSANGRFYLIAQDHQGGIDPQALAERAIGQDQLQDWLANRIKAKKAIILLDTCESGALVAGHRRSRIDDGPTSEAAVGRLHEATGRPVLTGAAAGKWALEGAIDDKGERHGVFTLALLKALREGDTNGNGLIELSELVAYVQTTVPNIAAGVDDEGKPGNQAARFGSRGEDFVVARRLQ
jgi:WD40 repeat protein/uncharacterized caspase-like protein